MAMYESAFTWYDSGAVAYPALHKMIIELTMPALVVKRLLPEFPLVAGRTATFVKESGSRSIGITDTGEGAEAVMDFTPLTNVTVTPYKKMIRERITREDIEDLYIPVIEQQLRRLARRTAYQIDLDCMNVIASGAASTSAATGKSIFATGSVTAIAGTIGTQDILGAEAVIGSYNFLADSIIVNPINARDLKMLPQFELWAQLGEKGMQTGPVNIPEGGGIGKVFGLNLYVTNVCSAGTAYVLSTGTNLSASYAPMGFFVIKRPLMTDIELQKALDSIDVLLSTRYSPIVLNGQAIAQITGLNTT